MILIDWWDLPSLTSFKGDGNNFTFIGKVTVDSTYGCRLHIRCSYSHQERSRVKRIIHGSERNELHKWDRLIVLTEDDALEFVVTLNGYVSPSEHLISCHPSVFWISRIDQMQHISSSVEHIVIQGCVGREEESFNLSNLSSLITLEMGCWSFSMCQRIVFDSMNEWLNDWWMRSYSTSINHSWMSDFVW